MVVHACAEDFSTDALGELALRADCWGRSAGEGVVCGGAAGLAEVVGEIFSIHPAIVAEGPFRAAAGGPVGLRAGDAGGAENFIIEAKLSAYTTPAGRRDLTQEVKFISFGTSFRSLRKLSERDISPLLLYMAKNRAPNHFTWTISAHTRHCLIRKYRDRVIIDNPHDLVQAIIESFIILGTGFQMFN